MGNGDGLIIFACISLSCELRMAVFSLVEVEREMKMKMKGMRYLGWESERKLRDTVLTYLERKSGYVLYSPQERV